MSCINKPCVTCFVSKFIGWLAHLLSFLRWRIWFYSCINLLFVVYPMSQSSFREVVILYHRSIWTSTVDHLQSFVLFMNGSCFEFSLQWVPHVLMLKCFGILFNALSSNVYVFEFLGCKHFMSGHFLLTGNEKWYHLANGPTNLSLS